MIVIININIPLRIKSIEKVSVMAELLTLPGECLEAISSRFFKSTTFLFSLYLWASYLKKIVV